MRDKIIKVKLRILNLDGGGRHIAVNSVINGKRAVLLIDTGASNSIFDTDHKAFIELSLEEIKSEGSGSGFNSEISNLFHGEIKELKISRFMNDNYPAIFTSMSHINKLYKSLKLPVIAGIIGSDFLVENDAIIDFGMQIMSLTKKTH